MEKYILIIFVVLAIGAIMYLFLNNDNQHQRRTTTTTMQSPTGMQSNPMMHQVENFANPPPIKQPMHSPFEDVTEEEEPLVSGSEEEMGYNSQPQTIGYEQTGTQMNQLPSECYPKDVLSSSELLPRNANTTWAQVSPSGQGSLADQNFLTSGFHIGINTVGQTLRNANRQLRSEFSCPQVKVSPWMQTTIEADVNRRPLEIGSGEL